VMLKSQQSQHLNNSNLKELTRYGYK